METTIDIGPMSAQSFEVPAGARLRICDLAGGQPGDLIAFNAHDPRERLSQARTRVENRSMVVTAGHALWTNCNPPQVIFRVGAATRGRHSLLFYPCSRYALKKRFGVSRDGCLEHLLEALKPWSVDESTMPDAVSLFFSVETFPDGKMQIGKHDSAPGDFIELVAEMDCIAAVSTCSVPISGRDNSGYTVSISRA